MNPRRYRLRGGNWKAFLYRQSGEMVVGGPAGTGKTLANLLHLLWFGETYPGARMLIVRKTRASLTESALVTWENLLGSDHPILGRPINRGNRREYRFPNGSVLVTGGMDRPDKVLSTEWDLVYVPEATDLSLLEWETLGGRLRAGAGPYDLIFGDCNPTTPAHWIYKRYQSGQLTLIHTAHKDNPRFWDTAANTWTPDGQRYVVDRLGRLTGPRRKRFLEGKWEAAEGLVYDGYDPAIHLLPHGWTPPHHWRRLWSIDWGFVDPLVILFWAIDPDGRLYLYREYYRSRQRVETAARWCADLIRTGVEPRPWRVVADHDPENSATFTHHSGVYCEPADKSDRDRGLQEMQGRFDVQVDGRPGIYLRPDSRCHEADSVLEAMGRPTSLLEEIVGYTWDTSDPDKHKDEPITINDHACFVAGTMVQTGSGAKPIEEIRAGELVMSSRGLQPVLAAGMTSIAAEVWELELDDGRTLKATGNHPVFVHGSGFEPLDRLRYGDCVHILVEPNACKSSFCRKQRRLNGCGSTALFTVGTQCPGIRHQDAIFVADLETASSTDADTYTEMCGCFTMEPSQPATKSIIEMATPGTTKSETLRCSQLSSIRTSTEKKAECGCLGGLHRDPSNMPKWFARRLSGTDLMPALSGTGSTQNALLPGCRRCPCHASSAVDSIPLSSTADSSPGFARSSAEQSSEETPESMTLTEPACDAAPCFGPAGFHVSPIALARVRSVRQMPGKEPVFNLTVANVPEYFANGIRVHNCDAARYACRAMVSQGRGGAFYAGETPAPSPY